MITSFCLVQDIEELLRLPPEKVLLKWMNFHLKKGGYKKTVGNFSSDLKVFGLPSSNSRKYSLLFVHSKALFKRLMGWPSVCNTLLFSLISV